jgi:hypothetical protein
MSGEAQAMIRNIRAWLELLALHRGIAFKPGHPVVRDGTSWAAVPRPPKKPT